MLQYNVNTGAKFGKESQVIALKKNAKTTITQYENLMAQLFSNPQQLFNSANIIHQQVIKSPSVYLQKNKALAMKLISLVPLAKGYYGLKTIQQRAYTFVRTNDFQTFVFQQTQNIRGYAITYYIGVNQKLINVYQQWLKDPVFLLGCLHATYQILGDIDSTFYLQCILINRSFTGHIISHTTLLYLFVQLFIDNFDISQVDSPKKKKSGQISVGVVRSEKFISSWFVDFLGFSMPFDFSLNSSFYKQPSTIQNVLSMIKSPIKQLSAGQANLQQLILTIQNNKLKIESQLIFIDQQQQKQIQQLNKKTEMSQQQKKTIAETVLKQFQLSNKKADQIQASQNIVSQKLDKIKVIIPIQSPTVQQAKIYLQNVIQFFKSHLNSFKRKFALGYSMSQLDNIPYDIALQIILNEKKRRFKRTAVINQINQSLSKLKKFTITQQNALKIQKQIRFQQRQIYQQIQDFIVSPRKQIQVLLQKGRRLINQSQKVDRILEKQYQILQTVKSKANQLFSSQSSLQQSISKSMKQSVQVLMQLSKQLNQNKAQFSFFSDRIQSILFGGFKILQQNIDTNFQNLFDAMKQQIILLQGRLGLNFQEIKQKIDQNTQLLKDVIKRLSSIAAQISSLRTQIADVKIKSTQAVDNTRLILSNLNQWAQTMKTIGIKQLIQNQNQRYNQLVDIQNKVKSINPSSIQSVLTSKFQQVKNSLNNYNPVVSMQSLMRKVNKQIQQYYPTIPTQPIQQKISDKIKDLKSYYIQLEQVQRKIGQSNLQKLKKELPQILTTFNTVFDSLGVGLDKKQNIFQILNGLKDQILYIKRNFKNLSDIKIGGSGGSGQGNSQNNSQLVIQIKQKQKLIQKLRQAVNGLYNIATQSISVQAQYLSDMLKDMNQKNRITKQDVQTIMNGQLVTRYGQVMRIFNIQVDKYKEFISSKKKQKKIQQVYNWWDLKNKRIKI